MNHDVVIVGGGMVGLTLACLLGRAGLRIALVEAREAGPAPGAGHPDLRVSAINRASRHVLAACGAWERLPAARLGPYREMHVWDALGGGSIHFAAADIGEPELGHIVENRCIQAALEQSLEALDGVRWYRPAKLEAVEVEAARAVLRVGDARLRAPLVVGADGTDSRVRALAGLPTASDDYGQRAVVATVATERSHEETAWQRFLPAGPLAFLPCFGGYSSIVWSTTPEQAASLLEMAPEHFAAAVEDAFEARLGTVRLVGARGAFPLRRLHAERYVAPRVALAGDAAHTIHPLAGQGVNLGLLDAAALAEVLADVHGRGRDPGGMVGLRRYERWRKAHNLAVQNAMDGFKWLFGSDAPALRLARSLGLRVTDRLDPVKHLVMRLAMGTAGDLPAAARGEPAHREPS